MVEKFTQDEIDEALNALRFYRDEATTEDDGNPGLKAESKEYALLTSVIGKLEKYASIYQINDKRRK